MDISTPPSLDLSCPQPKAKIKKYVHIFRDIGIDKIPYNFLCSSNNQFTMSSMVQKLHWELTNYNLSHRSNFNLS